jgi:hypothetical protein
LIWLSDKKIRVLILREFRKLYTETTQNLVRPFDRFPCDVLRTVLCRSALEEKFITSYVTSLQGVLVIFCYSRHLKIGNRQICLTKPLNEVPPTQSSHICTSECWSGDRWGRVPKYSSDILCPSAARTLPHTFYIPTHTYTYAYTYVHKVYLYLDETYLSKRFWILGKKISMSSNFVYQYRLY